MDKKAKKRVEVLRNRLITLRQKLAGAKQQPDDPGEAVAVEKEIAAAEAEIKRLNAT